MYIRSYAKTKLILLITIALRYAVPSQGMLKVPTSTNTTLALAQLALGAQGINSYKDTPNK